jgi:glycosyltransferase involved in cell wall biosynthesis
MDRVAGPSISVGVLAYDEAPRIGPMLESLVRQTIFDEGCPYRVEVVVVPNGCSDDTAEVAARTLATAVSARSSDLRWRVVSLEEAGKAFAWNRFVHELSDPASDYLVLADGDIVLGAEDSLECMVQALEERPGAAVAVDRPVKDVALAAHASLKGRLSSAVSRLSGDSDDRPWICGQLYCGRAQVLRSFELPRGLTAEDGFLYTMVTTDGLRSPPDPQRVVRAVGAWHVFDAYTDPRQLFRHEQWLVRSHVVNDVLFEHLRSVGPAGHDPGAWLAEANRSDPGWMADVLTAALPTRARRLPPSYLFTRRFEALGRRPLRTAVVLAPVAAAATMIDLAVSVTANRQLRRSSRPGYGGRHS